MMKPTDNADGGTGGAEDKKPLVAAVASPRRGGCFAAIHSIVEYFCFVYPTTCSCCLIGSIVFGLYFVIGLCLDPTIKLGVINNDYTSITSEYDLSLGKIDHWCIRGGDDNCLCNDPLEPVSRAESRAWTQAHKHNKNITQKYISLGDDTETTNDTTVLDVAFLGESLIEEMDGRWMGRPSPILITPKGGNTQSKQPLQVIEAIFNRNFKKESSGIEGVALGIAGDTSPNVLWRIQHGEMPDGFSPRVWWLSLGMNDLGRTQCSEEVVVLGVLRVVEEILSRDENAEVVINSMLPMADFRGGLLPKPTDYKDAFRDTKGKIIRDGDGPTLQKVLKNPKLQVKGDFTAGAGGGPKNTFYKRPEATEKALKNRNGMMWMMGNMGVKGEVAKGGVAAATGPKGAKTGQKGEGKQSKGENGPKRYRGLTSNGANADIVNKDASLSHRGQRRLGEDMMGAAVGGAMPMGDGQGFVPAQVDRFWVKRIEKDALNPKLSSEKRTIKARDPKLLFAKKNRLPLWTSVAAINKELKKFCEKHDRVSFFDATDIFAERVHPKFNRYVLRSDLISIRGHPTESGYALWEDAVMRRLKKMLEESDKKLAEELEKTQQDEEEKKEEEPKEEKKEEPKEEKKEEPTKKDNN